MSQATVSVLTNPANIAAESDWGIIPAMLEGESHTRGVLLHKGENGESECGVWECTPGYWQCHVERDEFCHFLSGQCEYISHSGENIHIEPGTIAFFPAGWKGTCQVTQTIRKVYMIR
ncbi:MAG: cupin domain-containing protein [Gammaproteobacteria bacterium]|nr:cupin domain-containing protein [Gammaproteobacteria bacterium]